MASNRAANHQLPQRLALSSTTPVMNREEFSRNQFSPPVAHGQARAEVEGYDSRD